MSKPLPLGEVSPKVTERARPLTEKLICSDTLTLTKRQLLAAQRLFSTGLALSGAHAPALPKGEPFVEEGRPCGISKASPSGRGVTAGDGEGKDADGDLRAQR